MTEKEKALLLIIASLQKRLDKIQASKRKSHHTHGIIRSAFLRQAYASELWQWRKFRISENADTWRGYSLGMESCFWAMQKAMGAE